MVTITIISSSIISTNPNNGDFNPKNNNDHKAFRASWIPNTIKKTFLILGLDPFIQTVYKDTPIRKYRIIQTGPNMQPGGANVGFVNVEYQSGTASTVKIEPQIPADWQMSIEIVNLRTFTYNVVFTTKKNIWLLCGINFWFGSWILFLQRGMTKKSEI